jgi:DNA-binding response OmpR family regulator
MLTPDEARAKGFSLDTTLYPWVAYKGARFQPTEIEQCYTEREAALIDEVHTLTAELENERTGKKFDYHVPMEWGLTPLEKEVFLQLLKREICSKQSLHASVWSDSSVDVDIPKAHIRLLRSKLKPFGISIGNIYGQGWFLEKRTAVKVLLRNGGKTLQ